MKRTLIVLAVVLGALSPSFCLARSTSSPDLDDDKEIVAELVDEGSSGAAMEYLKKVLENDPPSDANTEFGYAAIVQNIIVGLGKEGMKAAVAMDFASALSVQSYTGIANQVQLALLTSAAGKGHEGAKQMLQLKIAMMGGGNSNINSNSYQNGGNRSSVVEKTCSYCNGKGWVSGSKTPTYGNTGNYWCDECGRSVPQSHSHDRCPSCGGKGYTTGIR